MKENTKTILAMIGLVAIGFVGGYFTHAQLTHKHLTKIAKEATRGGFETRLLRIVNPNESIRNKIAPIVHEYAQKLEQTHLEVHHNKKAILDSLRSELAYKLSEKELMRLDRFIERQLRFRPTHEKNHKTREINPH